MNWDDLHNSPEWPHARGYVDSEVLERVTPADIIVLKNSWTPTAFTFEGTGTRPVEYDIGHDAAATYYRWTGPDKRLEYWVSEEYGSYIALEDNGMCWIMGCMGSHPYVWTTSFSFGNSDGSSDLEVLKDPTPDQLLKMLEEKTNEFIFTQIH